MKVNIEVIPPTLHPWGSSAPVLISWPALGAVGIKETKEFIAELQKAIDKAEKIDTPIKPK